MVGGLLLIGFHLFYCVFFKFANDLDCEQSLGLKVNLQAARRAVQGAAVLPSLPAAPLQL